MNSVLCRETDAALNEWDIRSDMISMNTFIEEESYITAPMVAMVRPNDTTEAELHDLFEAAISDRLLAMREQMNRISGPLSMSRSRSVPTEALHSYETETLATFRPASGIHWRRIVFFACMALMLAMLGFDVMGLLILAAR